MKVPFGDLGAQYRRVRDDVDAAIRRVLSSGWYVGGPEVEAFERAFATSAGVAHAVGVGNGTDAIALALRAVGVAAGDEVILPALSAYPTTAAVVQIGAVPVFVDVRLDDALIDPEGVEEALSPAVRAVVPVHLYGTQCDLRAIRAVAARKSVPIVEDCAQAHGAMRDGVGAGTSSPAAAWSFYPTKNLGAMGDAGAITTPDAAVAERLRRLRNYGQRNRYEHVEPGVNSRLDPLQAAVLAVKLTRLDDDNRRRRAIAARYEAALAGAGGLELILIPPGAVPSRHLFPIRLHEPGRRDEFQGALREAGVETLIHYPIAMVDQGASDPAWRRHDRYPNARTLCAGLVSLPIYPELADEQVDHVADAVRAALRPR